MRVSLDMGSQVAAATSAENLWVLLGKLGEGSHSMRVEIRSPDFVETESGLLVPDPEPKSDAGLDEETRDGFPVLKDWNYSKCGDRYSNARETDFRKRALEDLYTAVDPGGGRLLRERDKEDEARLTRLLNELSVALVGGIPNGCEEFT